jgi:hypothetical protein
VAKRGTSVYRVSVRGAGRVAAQFNRAQRQLQDEMIAELRQFGREAQVVFVEEAYEDTGELKERITVVPFFGRAARPRVSVRVRPDLQGHQGGSVDNYDYLGVTRRGHRSRTITPKTARALKVHLEGHRNQQIFVFRHSVSGVPAAKDSRWRGDWVLPAAERAERLSLASERRLGRRIESRVLR